MLRVLVIGRAAASGADPFPESLVQKVVSVNGVVATYLGRGDKLVYRVGTIRGRIL